jgi:hypothetical protein
VNDFKPDVFSVDFHQAGDTRMDLALPPYRAPARSRSKDENTMIAPNGITMKGDGLRSRR